MNRDRDQTVALAEISHVQLDVPVNAIIQLAAVTDPHIDVRLSRSTIWAGEVETDAARIVWHGYRRESEGHGILPANSSTDIKSLQTTF